MNDLIPGQRCVSNAELQLGLGSVLAVAHRTITVQFTASGETRTYAKQSAPLTRVAFAKGDRIRDQQGHEIMIDSVQDNAGVLSYCGYTGKGVRHCIVEAALDNLIQLNRPSTRLFNGQIDNHHWFALRYQTLQIINQLAHSPLYGLTGGRTSLIAHQLYIAHEVANRYAPRVLLADEVGLGKTIEAGLILQHQLLTERARRVLVIVPETLLHQWLVEMLRRFNLHFRIFDSARLDAVADEAADIADTTRHANTENPFLGEQLVLCSLDFLAANPRHYTQCLAGEWDLLVVDEAHHLQWSAEHASDEYQLIENLAANTRGVLLLTATPEQLGKESHFARLRLLDPARFVDFDSFIAEEKSYQPIAQVVQDLLEGNSLSADDTAILKSTIGEGDNATLIEQLNHATQDAAQARIELVDHLLDRHGTGRVLFRNTRATVKGFPARVLITYPLAQPEQYQNAIGSQTATTPHDLLAPERCYATTAAATHWTSFDPRLTWLGKKLCELQAHKVLVIAASAATALAIAGFLKQRMGMHAALFHEGLSIVERDRAAAYFAEADNGAQVLVCSEIGSEGRNFQFAHHMVLFDLPLNPDLLEQRIGRLDRIGQSETIKLHVPYFEHSAQQVMLRWYHEALSAFEHTSCAGYAIFSAQQQALLKALAAPDDMAAVDALIADARALCTRITAELQRGRDRLLEYNSCRLHVAEQLKVQAEAADAKSTLADFMEHVFDVYGVDSEIHSDHCFIIRPSEHMVNPFPGLHDDGMTITFDRNTALSFEDAHYLTWEHPMVRAVLDRISTSESGNTALITLKTSCVPAGTLLLEAVYTLEATALESLHAQRYLPPTHLRVVVDEHGRDQSRCIKHQVVNQHAAAIAHVIGTQVVHAKQAALKALLVRCEQLAEAQAPDVIKQAHARASSLLASEANRLSALQRVNPSVRDEEIAFYKNRLATLDQVINTACMRLDALRVIIAT